MKKRFLRIILIELIILFILVYILAIGDSDKDLNKNFIFTGGNEEYTQVNLDNSELYSKLEKALLNGDEEVRLREISLFIDPEKIFKILNNISNKNPEVMYYKGAEYKLGQLKIFYSKSKEDINNHRTKIREKREEFMSKYIHPDMSDYEKLLTIHDYIVNNSRYDERLLQGIDIPPESYSTFGVFVRGLGVCEGYAKTMQYLLEAANIESLIVVGESRNENHAWNLVKLDDEYYHIDSTWNDPVTFDGSNILRYNYFNLTDEEISKTHSWNQNEYPSATGKRYNYYKYNNLIVEGNSGLEKIIKESLLDKQSSLAVKIEDFNNKISFDSRIIEDYAYKNYDIIGLKGYSYSIDEDFGILHFNFYY